MQKRIESAVKRYEKTLEQLKADEKAYAQSLLDAYQEGMTWDDVARIAGLGSGNQARLRAMRAKDQSDVPPSRRRQAGGGTVDVPKLPGLSVEDAAKKLKVTPPTVYKRIDRGELEAVTDSQGRTRVILD